ncbi:YciI family protein [Lysobacter terrae]
MKKFMAVFTGAPESMAAWQALDAAERQRRESEGMQAWKQWAEANAQVIVDQGAPLGRTKRITSAGITDTRNNLAAYTVVEAESQEAAARLFEKHPHFTIFPGDGVEVMECLPLPGM